MSDIVAAVQARLLQDSGITATVGSGADIQTGAASWPSWIFQWVSSVVIEGTGHASITIRQEGAWQSPSGGNTTRFPRIRIIVTADPDRDASRHVTVRNGYSKCIAVVEAVDKVMHRPEGISPPYPATGSPNGELWGTVRVIDSSRLDEPTFDPEPVSDSDFASVCTVHYALTVG
jgi:hypothetical protein